jgi:hypothetical protein
MDNGEENGNVECDMVVVKAQLTIAFFLVAMGVIMQFVVF